MEWTTELARRIMASQNEAHHYHDDIDEVEAERLRLDAARLVRVLQPREETTLPGLYVSIANTRLGFGVKTNGPWDSSGEIFWALTKQEADQWAQELLTAAAGELRRQHYHDTYGELRQAPQP